ncbi:MAG: alternative ribosome rescue aminoacyl-tRNA hydrolase ArfB [Acetobacteraceae bacterium]|nr:alternative ribosome rescue aminoacyl-tRNA hydrolase ArfB [Acetobacteraceae bacterium]
MISVTRHIALSEDEISESFVRASGPGGQNVNKVSTAVMLRFDVANSPNLPDPVKYRLARLAGSRITKDGVLILTAQEFASQLRNREAAMAMLLDLIRAASIVPKTRRATKPTYGSQLRRLDEKSHRKKIKRDRGSRSDE